MSNELTTVQLPAHILAAFKSNPAIASIGEGLVGAHPKIGLDGTAKEFFLKENQTSTSLGASIEVMVVGINPNKSITVYAKAFDPREDASAPLWSSEDGTPVPNEFAGKVISESRKWAVLLANNPTGPVYELRVPAASMFRGDTYRDKLDKRGCPIAAVVTKISFDPAEKYARFIYEPTSYVSVEQADAITKAAGSVEVNAVLGLNKKAARTQQALPAPVEPEFKLPEPAAEPKRTRTRSAPAETLPFQPTAAQNVVTKPQAASSDLEQTIANVLKL